MNNSLYLMVPFVLSACAAPNRALELRIERVEGEVIPMFQIEDQDPATFSVEDRLRELDTPGLSVAFVANGEIEWAIAYGMADTLEGRRMDTATLLRVGSISKPVTALRVLQLAEQEEFDLDENVNIYLNSWQLPDNKFTQIEKATIRRILNHTAGLTMWGDPEYHVGDEIPTLVELLDGQGNTGPIRVVKEPGESSRYSNGGYAILQLAITDHDGVSYPETMRENVLDRLRMPTSTFESPLPDEFHSHAATGYWLNGDEIEEKWPIYPALAPGGLWATPSELIQYAIEIQRIYQNKQDGILKYATVVEMLTPGKNNFGLGPQVIESIFGHGGTVEGFRALLIAWKDRPFAVVAMVNSENDRILYEVLLAIASEYELPLPAGDPDGRIRHTINHLQLTWRRIVRSFIR